MFCLPHRYVSIIAPMWMGVFPKNSATCPHCTSYFSHLNASVPVDTPHGFIRLTFRNDASASKPRWSVYNDGVPLYFTFDGAHVGDAVTLRVLIHAHLGDAASTLLTNWQPLHARCVAMPHVALPKRLVSSWAPEFGGRIVFRPRQRMSSYFLLKL